MNARRLSAPCLALMALCACGGPGPAVRTEEAGRRTQTVLHVDSFTLDGSLERCWTIGDGVPWDAAAIAIGRAGWVTTAFSTRPRSATERPSLLVMATSADLGLMWSTTVDGDAGCAEAVTAIAFDGAGNTWLASKQMPGFAGAAPPTWILRRFGPQGRLEWTRSACFATCAGIVTALLPAGKRDIVVAGIEEKMSVMARFPPGGWPVWSSVNDGAHLVGLAGDGSGSVYACGVRPLETGEAWEIVKLGGDGTLLWSRSYSGRAHLIHPARANALAAGPSGELYVGGSETGPSIPPGEDWLLRRYSAAGDLVWERSWNGLDNRRDLSSEAIRQVATDPFGGVYALGETRINNGEPSAILRKYSSVGDLVWTRTAPGTAALAVITSGRIVAAGVTRF